MAKVGIFVGTVYGNAMMVAEAAEALLIERGHQVELFDEGTLDQWRSYQDQRILVITSTTGQGDLPDSIALLFDDLKEKVGYQPQLSYGLIALGDSSYEHFCGAGKRFDGLLQEQGAKRLGDILLIDAAEVVEPEAFAQDWIKQWCELIN